MPDSATRLTRGGSALVSPAASTITSQGGAIPPSREGISLSAAPPMIRQESASSRRSVMDKDQGDFQSDGVLFVKDGMSAHRRTSYQGHFPGSAAFLDNGSSISLNESLSSTKGSSHLDLRMKSMSPPGSNSASIHSTHSRTASSLSLASSVNSATHLNPSPAPTYFLESGSQISIGGSAQQLPPIRERYRRVYSRSPSHKLTTSTDSSIYTSNESGSLLSWRSDPEEIEDDFSDHQIAVASSVRSRASSRAASLLGNEMESTMTTAKGHTLYHLPSRSVASVTVSPPASPTRATVPNGTLELSPRSRYRRLRHTPQSSVSSLSSISSSLVGTSANLTRLRAILPIGSGSPPATPPKTATHSPTKDDQLTPSFRSGKPYSASTPPSLVATMHPASSRQHDADLVRAVRALEAEAEIAVLAATGGAGGVRVKHHQSLTPAAAKSLARMIPSGERASDRPEMHARSRSHDLLASTITAQSRPSRDRSASHPYIVDEVGYAV